MPQTDPWADFKPAGAAPPSAPQARPGGVFVPAPGAAEEQARKTRDEGRSEASLGNDATRIGISQAGEARAETQATFGNAGELRKEFRLSPQFKNYETVIRQFSSALKTGATPTGDQALITAYAKMLDPTSVVREQEFNTVAAGDSAIGKTIARVSKELGLEEGGILRPEVRARVRRTMLDLTKDYRLAYEQARTDYSDIAARNKLAPEDVIGSHLGDAYRGDIEKNWKPEGGQSGASSLGVAKGNTFSTEQDLALARQLQEAWNGGASPDEINALSQKITGKPLSEKDLQTLRDQVGGAVSFAPASSGKRESGEQISGGVGGDVQSMLAGSVRGYMANMPEELAPLLGVQPEQVQAALDAYAEKNPVASFMGEMGGSLLSPINKLMPGGGLGAQVAKDALYSGVYGAGEGAPGAGMEERAIGAGLGALTGGAASYGVGKVLAGKGDDLAAKFVGDEVPAGAVDPEPPITPTAAPTPPPVSGTEATQIAQLSRQAVGRGPGTAKAKRELAKMAQSNPEAKAAAERLGVDLPPDVLSDNAQLKSLTGMARSQVGSEAEAAWKGKVAEVATKADNALAELGATADLAQASDDVFQRLNGSMESLQRQGDDLRKEVDAALDVRAPVEAGNLQKTLATVINDYGGITEAKQAFTNEERKLLAMLGEGETAKSPTYARLNTMRDQIGRALNKNEGPWADTPRANLARYYAALADDQLAHIETAAGTEVADKMRASNTLFKQMYEARDDMQEVFGRDLDKSLAPLLNRAITQGGKGDIQALNKLISRVPEDMRGGLLASGLLSQAQGKGAQGAFSFANYAKAYRGLRDNGPVYQQFAKALGPEGDKVMADLYAISRRMVDADSNVLRTGKANQALLALNAERLVSRVMKGTVARTVGTVAGGAAGGPVGAGLAMATQEMLAHGGAKNTDRAHALLSSPEFRALIEKMGTESEDAAVNRLGGSKALREYLPKSVTDPRAWVRSAMAVGTSAAAPEPVKIELETTR